MAEGGRPAFECFPPGPATVPPDSAVSPAPLLPLSTSSAHELTSGVHQEEPRTTGDHRVPCSRRDSADGSLLDSQGPALDPHRSFPCLADPVPPGTSARPHSIAGAHTSHGQGGTTTSLSLQTDRGTMLSVCRESPAAPFSTSSSSQMDLRRNRLGSGSLPVQRSHSDTLHMVREAGAPSADGETSWPGCPGRDCITQEAQLQAHPMFICKQPMQVQHCNTVTTTCRGGSSGGGSPKQQPQGGYIGLHNSGSSNPTAEVCGEAHPHPQREECLCYRAFVHHGTLEDTFAAYCHPQPIPAPAQMLPRLAGMETDGRDPRVMPHPASNLLALPRLISSVSETGLDAKGMLRCCNLNCTWAGALPPGGGGQPHVEEGSGSSIRSTTRDTGTMTACRELRDVGVQTVPTPQGPPPHVFPQVCFVEENGNGTGNANGVAEVEVLGAGQKSPVKEVKWDAEGMTWEVYGASVDPEELGLAIQRHLELQIKETAGRAAKLSRQDTTTSRQSSSGTGRRRTRSGVMASLRNPACCARSSTAVD